MNRQTKIEIVTGIISRHVSGQILPQEVIDAATDIVDRHKKETDELLDALRLAAAINPYGSVENAQARDAAAAALAALGTAKKPQA